MNACTRPLLALSLVLIASGSLPAATVEERLLQLESRIDSLSKENETLRRRLGEPSSVPVVAQGKEKALSIGGYAQFQAEFGDSPDSRFPAENRIYIRRARLGVKASYLEDIDFVLQAELGSGKLTANTNYSANLADVYAVWKKYDFANVTLGQFKTPFGYEQAFSDVKLPLIERSLANDKLTLSRQIGAMVSGDIGTPRLHYAAGAFNGTGTNTNVNDNDSFSYVGRINGALVDRKNFTLTAGANAFQSHDTAPAFTGSRNGLGLDLQAASGPVSLAAEWLRVKSDPDAAARFTAEGWSVLAGYMVVPKTLQAVVRYETFDPKNTVSGDDTDIWTFGFNYFLKGDDLKLSLNYVLGDPAGASSNQGRVLARVQVVF